MNLQSDKELLVSTVRNTRGTPGINRVTQDRLAVRYRLWVKACSDTFDEQVCQLWICEALTALCCQLLDSPAKTGK
jgi:hypothetical protein